MMEMFTSNGNWAPALAGFGLMIVGCMGGVGDHRAASTGVAPDTCVIAGAGSVGTSTFEGQLVGTSTSGSGVWVHDVVGGGRYVLSPDFVTCRINGIAIADSGGTVFDTGETFSLHVEDVNGGSDGETATVTLEASHAYRPTEWSDGVLEGINALEVPSLLPVVDGSSGNGWAYLRFTRSTYGDEVTCRYRGNGARPGDTGSAYDFVRCVGEEEGTPSAEAGDLVATRSAVMRVQNGGHPAGTTRVEVDISVVGPSSDPDLYLLQVSDGLRVIGFLDSGDVSVTGEGVSR